MKQILNLVTSRLVPLTLVASMSLPAFAQQMPVIESEAPAPEAMQAGQMYYNYKIFDFKKWAAGPEKDLLNLFPGFGKGRSKKAGGLVILMGKTSMVVDRPASEVDVAKLVQIGNLQSIQAELADIVPLNPADINVAKDELYSYKNNPAEAWCSSPSSLCVTSTFKFDAMTSKMVAAALLTQRKTNTEISYQSQVKVMNASEIATPEKWSEVTKVPTLPVAMVAQDIFWVSNAVEFGKIVGVVQPHPTDPAKSILTGYTIFAIEQKWWDKDVMSFVMKDYALGTSYLNGSTGLTMGLPKVTQKIFSDLVQGL